MFFYSLHYQHAPLADQGLQPDGKNKTSLQIKSCQETASGIQLEKMATYLHKKIDRLRLSIMLQIHENSITSQM